MKSHQTVTIPDSLKAVKGELEGIGILVTSKEWTRGAYVTAFTPTPASIKDFARLGIHGLTQESVVAGYRNAWLAAVDARIAKPVQPGQTVELPDAPWSNFYDSIAADTRYQSIESKDAIRQQAEEDGVGATKALDIAKNKKAMAAAIKADAKVAQAAAAALMKNKKGRKALVEAAYQAEEEEADEERGRKMPPLPMPETGARGAFVFVNTVRKAVAPLHEALKQYEREHFQMSSHDREVLDGILEQVESAVAQVRMAAEGTVSDSELAAILRGE
jgi:hypothetical protein